MADGIVEKTKPPDRTSRLDWAVNFGVAAVIGVVLTISSVIDTVQNRGWNFVLSATFLGVLLITFGGRGKLFPVKSRKVISCVVAVAMIPTTVVVGLTLRSSCAPYTIDAKATIPYAEFAVTTLAQCPPKDGGSLVLVTTVREGADRHFTYYLQRAVPISKDPVTMTIRVLTNDSENSRTFSLVSLDRDDWVDLTGIPQRAADNSGVWGGDAAAVFTSQDNRLRQTDIVTKH